MASITVVVCGSRDWPYPQEIERRLMTLWLRSTALTVVEGGATGADRVAALWAARMAKHPRKPITWMHCPADWDQHGKAAGPIRNGMMARYLVQRRDAGDEVAVLAFHRRDSRGTANMIEQARALSIQCIVITCD
jgi:hypothetical protein